MAVAQLAMGAHHTGAITENGVLYMWDGIVLINWGVV